MGIVTSNDEWITPRDLQREAGKHLARLESGEVEKLVIVKGREMKAVIVRADDYERLVGGDQLVD